MPCAEWISLYHQNVRTLKKVLSVLGYILASSILKVKAMGLKCRERQISTTARHSLTDGGVARDTDLISSIIGNTHRLQCADVDFSATCRFDVDYKAPPGADKPLTRGRLWTARLDKRPLYSDPSSPEGAQARGGVYYAEDVNEWLVYHQQRMLYYIVGVLNFNFRTRWCHWTKVISEMVDFLDCTRLFFNRILLRTTNWCKYTSPYLKYHTIIDTTNSG